MCEVLNFFKTKNIGAPAKTCVSGEALGIEDARRVGDPTSIARPCKTIEDGRSLVLGNQWNMCIEDELRLEQKPTKDLRLAKKFLYEAHLH